MGTVVDFTGSTTLDYGPERALERLKECNLEGFVLIGYDAEGEELFYTTYADIQKVNWLLDRYKKYLLEYVDAE